MRQFAFFLLWLLLPIAVGAETLETVLMPGHVIEGHAKWEDACDKCHQRLNKAGQRKLCADCHKEIAKDIASRRGYHGKLEPQRDCRECHTDHKGRNAKVC